MYFLGETVQLKNKKGTKNNITWGIPLQMNNCLYFVKFASPFPIFKIIFPIRKILTPFHFLKIILENFFLKINLKEAKCIFSMKFRAWTSLTTCVFVLG